MTDLEREQAAREWVPDAVERAARAFRSVEGSPIPWEDTRDAERMWARSTVRLVLKAYGIPDELEMIAADMERAADLHDRDPHRPVTSYDARRWAEELRALHRDPDATS